MKEKNIEVIPRDKEIKITFSTNMVGSLRTALEVERKLRSNLNDVEFSELVIKLCKFEEESEMKDYSLKMILYFVARFETQCKEDKIYEYITEDELEKQLKESKVSNT